MKELDWKKPLQFRDSPGKKIVESRLLKGQSGNFRLLVIYEIGGSEEVCFRRLSGRIHEESQCADDIINVPEKPLECWINVYTRADGLVFLGGNIFQSEVSARNSCSSPAEARLGRIVHFIEAKE